MLGFVVWQGGKWYLKRRSHGLRRKAALTALAGLVVGGVIVAQRQHATD